MVDGTVEADIKSESRIGSGKQTGAEHVPG